jgi:hypothetical protein
VALNQRIVTLLVHRHDQPIIIPQKYTFNEAIGGYLERVLMDTPNGHCQVICQKYSIFPQGEEED